MPIKLSAYITDPVAYGYDEDQSEEELLEKARENLVIENCEPDFHVDDVTLEGLRYCCVI